MDLGGIFAMLIVLVIAVMAIVYFIRKQAGCPPTPAAVSFWTVADNQTSVSTGITCPPGTVISVQAADYGAPWGNCAWGSVAPQAAALMNGQPSYTIPANTNLMTLLNIPDPCSGTPKTFAGAYTCVVPATK